MPSKQASRLFGLQCRHGYFAHGICMPLVLHPTSGCQQLLAQYQLTFKAEPGGGSVYDQSGGHLDWAALAEEHAAFTFAVQCHDPALLNYTHSPFAGTEDATQLFYFDNLVDHGKVHGRVRLLACDDTLERHTLSILPSEQADATTPPAVAPSAAYSLDPQLAHEIERTIHAHRAATLKLWRPHGGSQGLWGIIAIYPGKLALSESGRSFSAPLYSLDLAPRQTHWRYYIVQPPKQHKVQDFELVAQVESDDSPDMIFTRQSGDTRLGGRPAQVFVAPAPLPLLQQPGDAIRVQLRSPYGRPMSLPYPQAHALARGADGRVYSEVFVHL
ncbi:hypothetical protein [Chitinimonas naiadis]